MIKPVRALLAAFVVSSFLVGGAGPADAAAGRVKASAIGLNAAIVKVAVKDGRLQIGDNLHVLYTAKNGDPPCDQSGSTLYVGHAWKDGDGVADKFGQLTRGDIIYAAGCKFRVTKREFWSDDKKIASLSSPGGKPRIALYGCKADDYSKGTVVFARKVGGSKPFG